MGRLVGTMRRVVRLLMVIAAIATLLRLVRRLQGASSVGAGSAPGWRGPAWFRHLVTNRFNPFVVRHGLVGGRRSPWAFIEHRGRKSGTVRRTPILPSVVGDHVAVPLPYGRNAHWARNVLASGHCRMQLHERVYELDEPQVLAASDVAELPAWRQPSSARRGLEYLRLRVFSVQPGTLDTVEAQAPGRDPAAGGSGPVTAATRVGT
jgi:deazaflavin-dependent oxidoreductase (nitroreductase family)